MGGGWLVSAATGLTNLIGCQLPWKQAEPQQQVSLPGSLSTDWVYCLGFDHPYPPNSKTQALVSVAVSWPPIVLRVTQNCDPDSLP